MRIVTRRAGSSRNGTVDIIGVPDGIMALGADVRLLMPYAEPVSVGFPVACRAGRAFSGHVIAVTSLSSHEQYDGFWFDAGKGKSDLMPPLSQLRAEVERISPKGRCPQHPVVVPDLDRFSVTPLFLDASDNDDLLQAQKRFISRGQDPDP